ncbi:MAG: hypothetical protein K2Q10_09285 [Rhodospirillales bacterium]|nr:hypothetical protein [Rhodospirillales bacterium]
MTDYAFYVALLRFVVRKTEQGDARIAAMMNALGTAATAIESTGAFVVTPDRLELTARAFAGVAGLLQRRILPEVVAHGNQAAEAQIRWAVDAAMEAVNLLLQRAALPGDSGPVRVELPVPPAASLN